MVDISKFFIPVRDRVAAIAQQFQVPNCHSLIVVKRQRGDQTTYLRIEPDPIIRSVSPQLVSESNINTVQIELDDLQVYVSAKYTEEQLTGPGIHYLIGAEMVDGRPVGGYEADRIENAAFTLRTTDWELLLRRRS